MAKYSKNANRTDELLEELVRAVEQNTIVTLALKGVPGSKIRALVGGEMRRVTHVLKQLKGHKS